MKKNLFIFFCFMLLTSGCVFPRPLVTVENTPLVLIEGRQMKDIIVSAAAHKGWGTAQVAPDVIRCTLVARIHKVVVDVKFSKTNFSISYVGSENMGYDPASKTINRKYNQWVRNLEAQIIRESTR